MIGDKDLTGVTKAQILTHPGQAHFADPASKDTCHRCTFWAPKTQGDHKAVCSLAARMLWPSKAAKFPWNATACRYFEKP